jgi:hypothetical protein
LFAPTFQAQVFENLMKGLEVMAKTVRSAFNTVRRGLGASPARTAVRAAAKFSQGQWEYP